MFVLRDHMQHIPLISYFVLHIAGNLQQTRIQG